MPVSPKQQRKDNIKQDDIEDWGLKQEKTEPQTTVCIACSGTGISSKGGICIPCEKAGRIRSDNLS